MSDYTPSHWHKDECKAFIMSYAEPATAPCICNEVKAAYQRGREDAAQRVEAYEEYPGELFIDKAKAVAAARGDGEQA